MGIVILNIPEPMSEAALQPTAKPGADLASDAYQLLKDEVRSYCQGETRGRSFLISGHRGAGKTRMILKTLSDLTHEARTAQSDSRPVLVMLHGPSLFKPLADPAKPRPPLEERLGDALVQVILCLHREVLKDFSDAYRRTLLERCKLRQVDATEAAELAAQLEIELVENPTAMRLRELWLHAEALQTGVLFDACKRIGQGALELAALNGLCDAHQRVSGTVEASDKALHKHDYAALRASGMEIKGADALKPIAAVLSGAVVGGGLAASPTGDGLQALGLGLLTALAASVVLKRSSVTETKRVRSVDTTFIRDLSLRTLDRVLPLLVTRLRAAGLAPVFVIDELDKVECLAERLDDLAGYLKKLLTESVFTCFLTDRSYFEHLRAEERSKRYSASFSYFSHRILVAHEPADFRNYLRGVLVVDTALASDPNVSSTDERDIPILCYFFCHRSQLHALKLSRELKRLRGEGGVLRMGRSEVRMTSYRIEITLQVAIELQLTTPQVFSWNEQRPEMRQTLFDALYYLSRQWLDGAQPADFSPAGRSRIERYLAECMTLDDVRGKKRVLSLASEQPQPAIDDEVLTEDDKQLLHGVIEGIAHTLGEQTTLEVVRAQWEERRRLLQGVASIDGPANDVYECLLLGRHASLLLGDTSMPAGRRFEWRYSVAAIRGGPAQPAAAPPSPDDAPPSSPPGSPSRAGEAAASRRRKAVLTRTESQIVARGIVAYERGLRAVLLAPSESEEPGRALRFLGETARLLPPVPPLDQALNAIAYVESDAPNIDLNRETKALQELQAYKAMLLKHAQQVRDWLVVAAFLGGAGGDDAAPRAQALSAGLLLLSAGLRFAPGDRPLKQRLDTFHAELEASFGKQLPPSEKPGNEYNDAHQLPAALGTAAGLGAELRASLMQKGSAYEEKLQVAWNDFQQRALAFEKQKNEPAWSAPELVFEAMREGPTARLGSTSLAGVTLRTWSGVLMEAMGLADATAKQDGPRPPGWLAIFALRRLGLGATREEREWVLPAVLDRIEPLHQHPAHRLWLGTESASGTRPAATTRLAVVVAGEAASLTAAWTAKPTLGLCVLLTETEFKRLLDLKKDPFAAIGSRFAVWEQPSAGKDAGSVESSAAKNKYQNVWLYRQTVADMKQPAIVDALHADDLLASLARMGA